MARGTQRTVAVVLGALGLALGAPAAVRAQPAETPYIAQFGGDAQHTGRSPHRGPRVAPTVRWRIRVRHRVFASPARTADGLVVFAGVDGVVHAVDRRGVERWAFTAPDEVFASPAVYNETTLVAHDGGALVALDRRGQVRWTYRTVEDADASPTVASDGTVYLGGRGLTAVNTNGNARWTVPTSAHAFGAPALSRDGATAYLADLHGELLMARTRDGHVEHRVRVGAAVYGGALVLEDGGVVVGAQDGHVRAFAPDGTLRWDFATRGEIHGTPALGRDGTVIVGSDDGGIYGLRAVDGTLAFRTATSGAVRASARVDADGYIYIGSEDDVLYALDPRGAVAWTVTLGADIDDAVLLMPDGALAVGCDDAALYYLEAN